MEITTSAIRSATDSLKKHSAPPPSPKPISVTLPTTLSGLRLTKRSESETPKRVSSPKPGKRNMSHMAHTRSLSEEAESNENFNCNSAVTTENNKTGFQHLQKHQNQNSKCGDEGKDGYHQHQERIQKGLDVYKSSVDEAASEFALKTKSQNNDNNDNLKYDLASTAQNGNANPIRKRKDIVVWSRSGKGAPYWPSRFCTNEEIQQWPERIKDDKERPSEEEMPKSMKMRKMEAILEKLMNQDRFKWFCSPVDADTLGLVDYHDIIKQPMDLGTVQEKLKNHDYEDAEEIRHDIELTFHNALRYNPLGNPVHRKANSHLRFFKSEYAKSFGKQNPDVDNAKSHVFYFGTHEFGLVSKANIFPYYEFYDKLARKKKSYKFLLALEEAEEEILKEKHLAVRDSPCRLCGRISGKEDEEQILICDRCYGEVHMKCMNPPLASVPDGDFFCPKCVRDAPLTFKALGVTKEDLDYTKKRSRSDDKELQNESDKMPKKHKVDIPVGQVYDHMDTTTSSQPNSNDQKRDSTCFVCNEEGIELVSCNFSGCPRAYHKSCICVSFLNCKVPRERNILEQIQRFICPWHFCAICSNAEPKGSRLVLPCTTPPDEIAIFEEAEVNNQNGSGMNRQSMSSETQKPFLHCSTCVLGLCRNHFDVPLLLIDQNGKAKIPSRMLRGDQNGFFRCSYCRERTLVESKSRYPLILKPPSHVLLARILIRIWSALVNVNADLFCQYFGQKTEKSSTEASSTSKMASFLNDIKYKIWTFGYVSLEEFKQDVEHAISTDLRFAGNAAQALTDFRMLLIKFIRPYEQQLKEIAVMCRGRMSLHSELDGDIKGKTLLLSKYLYSPVSFRAASPAIQSEGKAKKHHEHRTLCLTGSTTDNLAASDNDRNREESKLEESDEAIGVLASLAQAATPSDSSEIELSTAEDETRSKNKNRARDQVPRTSEEVHEMLSEQANVLQQCLLNITNMKKAVAKSSFTARGNQEPSEAWAGGESSTATKYRMENANLRSRLLMMFERFKSERKARLDAEKSVRELKIRLKMLSSIAKIS